MTDFHNDYKDVSLPAEVVKLIHEVNLNSEKTKAVFIKIQDFTQRRDHLLKRLLVNLKLLEMNCFEEVMKDTDDSNLRNFDEIVKKPIDELKDIILVYLDGRDSVFQVPFEKILELTQNVLESVRAFKLSTLDQKRDRLDSLFKLPDADKD